MQFRLFLLASNGSKEEKNDSPGQVRVTSGGQRSLDDSPVLTVLVEVSDVACTFCPDKPRGAELAEQLSAHAGHHLHGGG